MERPQIPGELTIRPMAWSDLPFAAACTQAEGWLSEDLTTLQGFWLANPKPVTQEAWIVGWVPSRPETSIWVNWGVLFQRRQNLLL